MKKVYLWVIILSCSFIVACVDKPKDTQDGLPFIIDFEQCITNARNIKISDIADTIELVELKTPEELPVSMIWQFITVGDYWYIHASEGIYKFTNKGEYITKISGKGQGPSEYSTLCGIAVDTVHKEFVINDYTKLIFFDFDGNFIRMENKEGSLLDADFSDGVLWGTDMALHRDKYMLYGLNRLRDTIYSIPNFYYGIKPQSAGGVSYMSLYKPFYHYAKTLYMNGPGANDTIYQLKGSQCRVYAAFNMGKYKLPLKYQAWYNYEAHWKNGYHYWNIPAIAEDERYLFILAQRYAPLNGDRGNRDDIYRYLMYDKKERIGFQMNEDKNEKITDDILGGPSIWPYWVTDDHYIGMIDPYSYKKKIEEDDYKLSPQLEKIVDDWNYDTNVLLMLCRKKKMN